MQTCPAWHCAQTSLVGLCVQKCDCHTHLIVGMMHEFRMRIDGLEEGLAVAQHARLHAPQ